MSNPTNTCGVTVIATNSTGQGNITFSTFSFLSDGSFDPVGNPFTITTTLPQGETATILTAAYQKEWVDAGGQGPVPTASTTSGTAIFNFPNGQPLTISWELDAFNGGNMPTIVPGIGYMVSGTTSPTQDDGYNYTFNINVSPQ